MTSEETQTTCKSDVRRNESVSGLEVYGSPEARPLLHTQFNTKGIMRQAGGLC